MTVKELREKLGEFSPEAEVILIDLSTDDPEDVAYEITDKDIGDLPLQRVKDDQMVEGVGIAFYNRLNPDPLIHFTEEDLDTEDDPVEL